MKIIKKGILPKYTKTFTCEKCGCIFEADKTEYFGSSQMEVMHDGLPGHKCKCPTCGNMVYAD